MANSVIKLSGVTFTGNLPKLEKDIIIPTQGGMLLFDFSNPATWGGTLPAAGAAVPTTQSFTNLIRGAAGGTVPVAGLAFNGNGLDFSGATAGRVSLGTYDVTSKSLLWIVWVKLPATGTAYAGYLGSAADTSNTNVNNSFVLYGGASGLKLLGETYDPNSNQRTAIPLGTDAPGTLHQMAVEFNVSTGLLVSYLDGAQVSSGALAAGVTSLRAAPLPLGIGAWNGNGTQGAFKGRIYRAYQENLTLSGRTALSVVQADYAANNGRFS
jgi:hypothetical protein